MAAADQYDYLVVNDQLEEAAEGLAAIIIAERARARRRPTGEPVKIELAQ
jgi:guanylate kinase